MTTLLHSPFPFFFTTVRKKTNTKPPPPPPAAKFSSLNNDDPPLKAALTAASCRFQESLRPDPLFIDPYAGCFLSSVTSQKETRAQCTPEATPSSPCYYNLVTKYIDDNLLCLINSSDEVRQIVLLTDGMDTRPYRLRWPRTSVIYDVSPGNVFKAASRRLEGVGAKISKSCMLTHVPLETANIEMTLCNKGFSGARPSLWVLQGLPLMTLTSFEDILSVVSSLAMEGCVFMGELPASLLESELGDRCTIQNLMESLFLRHGFQVDVIGFDEITRYLQLDSLVGDYKGVLFTAKQLRLSDAQMEAWRKQFQRLEEDADEEGFEEL